MATRTRSNDEATVGGDQPQSTRDRLIEAAARELDRNPAGPIRLTEVLRTADASPSSLDHFFGSLSGLVREARIARFEEASMVAAYEQFRSSVDGAISRVEFADALDSFLEHLAGPTRTPARRARASAVLAAANDAEVTERLWEAQSHLYAALSEVVEAAARKGFVSPDVHLDGVIHYSDALFFGYLLSETLDREDLRRHWHGHARESIYVALFREDGFALSRRG
jgi:AcrR family transcriptional regulator